MSDYQTLNVRLTERDMSDLIKVQRAGGGLMREKPRKAGRFYSRPYPNREAL
jgi:hypothetical protein